MERILKSLAYYYRNNPQALICYKISGGKFIRVRRSGDYVNEKDLLQHYNQLGEVRHDKFVGFVRKKLPSMCTPLTTHNIPQKYLHRYYPSHDAYMFQYHGQKFMVFYHKGLRHKLTDYGFRTVSFYRIRHRKQTYYLEYDVTNRFMVYFYLYLSGALNRNNKKIFKKACLGFEFINN
jgi:hypothetical protein